MLQHSITSILAFASTNIDDLFILMMFYSAKKSNLHVMAGQYLGIAALVMISVAGAYVGNFVNQQYVGLLGLFPIYLAIKQVVLHLKSNRESEEENLPLSASGILAVAGVTIANGADNIGVYVPLLTTMSIVEKVQLVIIFAIMVYVWCMTARYLANHPLIASKLDRYGHVITPLVLFCLGIFILLESGSFALLG